VQTEEDIATETQQSVTDVLFAISSLKLRQILHLRTDDWNYQFSSSYRTPGPAGQAFVRSCFP